MNYTASTLGDGDASPRAGRDPGRPETLPVQAADACAAQTPASVPAPAE